MGKAKDIFRLMKKDRVSICRVSDLLEGGIDPGWLENEFVRLNREVWGDIADSRYLWSHDMIESHFKMCPEFIYCGFERGNLVATLTNMRTTEEDMRKKKTWLERTDNGFLTTHRPEGDIGFGVDLSVSRRASKRVSDRIVLAALCVSLVGEGLQAVYLGARIPGYHKHQDMSVEEYVYGKRNSGKPLDPELYFYLKNGFEIVEVIPHYIADPASLNYGVLIRWSNPLYSLTKALPFLKPMIRFIGKSLHRERLSH